MIGLAQTVRRKPSDTDSAGMAGSESQLFVRDGLPQSKSGVGGIESPCLIANRSFAVVARLMSTLITSLITLH